MLKLLKTNFLKVLIVYRIYIDYAMRKCCFVENTAIITFNDHSLTLIVPVMKYSAYQVQAIHFDSSSY